LSRTRLFTGLLVLGLGLTAGCKAQSAPTAASPAVTRNIELQVRSEFDLPSDVEITLGARKPSAFTGYDTLPVTLVRGAKNQEIDFLISSDGTKLVHMNVMDVTKAPGDSIALANRPIRGNPSAKVTVINFDDLECPYCARMHQQLFPATMQRYGDKVRFIYKDNPLVDIHPWALHAAVDANCIAAQSGAIYWTYVDYLHSHGDEITGEDRDVSKSYAALDRIANEEATVAKLDGAQLSACIAKQDTTQVMASAKEASDLGLEGTPELYVNGERINGAVPQDQVWAVIDRALRAEGEQPPPAPAAAAPAVATPAPAAGSK
jgi:protein-disulfide isomerase